MPITSESIAILYGANRITYERCVLYSDFIKSLLMIVFDTYMGDDVTSDTDKINHFNWCWNKNLSNFKKEGITIGNEKIYLYLSDFLFEVYYPITNKFDPLIQGNIIKLWEYIFDYNNTKSESDVDTLIEVYKLF